MELTFMNRELRILMLEDSPTDTELTEHALRNGGIVFTSIRVETQDAFISALEEFHPDIILSDYKLPAFDGMTAVKIVQRDHPEIPVIMVTGALTDIKAVELIHAGAKDYVLKDQLARLVPAVQRTLAAEQSIRARKAAEKALCESEAKLKIFRTLLDNSSDAIEVIDPLTLRFVDMNETKCRELGYSREELLSMSISDIDRSFNADLLPTRLEQASQPGGTRFEGVHWRKDGSSFPVEISAKFIELDKQYVLCIARDISERKRMELALVESQERFSLFMDTLPAAVFIKDEKGAYVYVNRYVVNNVGERDWLGKTDQEIFPPKLAEKLHADDLRALEKGFLVEENQIPRLDGQLRLMETHKFRIPRQGQPPLLGGITLDFTEQRRNAEQYRSVIQASLDGYWVTDASGHILEANDSICRMHGYSREELLRLSISEIDVDETPAETDARIREMMKNGHVQFEARHKRKDGTIANVEVSVQYVATLGERFFAFIKDITERKQVEEELRIAATAFESQEGMVITDADNVILRVNRAYTEITGYTAQEAVGRRANMLKSGYHDATFYAGMWEALRRQGSWQGEVWNRRKNGEVYPEWLTITVVKGEAGEVTHYVGTLTDITLRKAAENEIKHLAFYDPLTRLPNRRLLQDRLQQALASSARNRTEGALLFIDLDNFKTLNDTLGHDIGDLLLQQVARRLTTCIREGDTVARLGGDEFVVMLEDMSENPKESATQTETVCEKILLTLNQPYLLAGHPHHSTPSIGATLFNDHEKTVDEILKGADLAMYQAKAAGRNTFRFFDPEMQATVTARATLEADMRQGLQQNEFLLYYQPQVDENGRMTGAEALVRWQHPRRDLMLPAEFIPLAEETGLILPLGHWVLKTACTQLVAWAAQTGMAHLTLAVNVSAHQFHRKDFVDQVLEVLDQTGANPLKLKLELTESLLLEDVEDIIAKMAALKAKGVGFSLDDFGTGYSSLSYLKRLPLDQLKIDQSFVRDILTDSNDAAIARTIIALAQSMGLESIAEGVETIEQRDFLASQSCHAFQGYLFGRPLPIDEFGLSLNRD